MNHLLFVNESLELYHKNIYLELSSLLSLFPIILINSFLSDQIDIAPLLSKLTQFENIFSSSKLFFFFLNNSFFKKLRRWNYKICERSYEKIASYRCNSEWQCNVDESGLEKSGPRYYTHSLIRRGSLTRGSRDLFSTANFDDRHLKSSISLL